MYSYLSLRYDLFAESRARKASSSKEVGGSKRGEWSSGPGTSGWCGGVEEPVGGTKRASKKSWTGSGNFGGRINGPEHAPSGSAEGGCKTRRAAALGSKGPERKSLYPE